MSANPAEIFSSRAEPSFDDEDGAYLGCGRCDECDDRFEPNDPKIVMNDFIMCLVCAENIVKELTEEIKKYK